jgi:DNA-binding NtrC family response regulator
MSEETRRPVSILVVDDDDTVRRVLRRMLESADYEVREATNGRHAMVEFRRQPADLLITDIFMPEQEGMETIRALRQEHPGLKIIAISGAAGDPYLKMASMLGAWATLHKPLRLATVLQTVREALNGSAESPSHAA